MKLKHPAKILALLLTLGFVLPLLSQPVEAGVLDCCPSITFWRVRPPCIKYRCVCPKSVCGPCNVEHYGYYQTCWHPWLFPPDYSHCRIPPTTNSVPSESQPSSPPTEKDELLPVPKTYLPNTK
jgi:hypothetical protein